jgi:hypothetical protein
MAKLIGGSKGGVSNNPKFKAGGTYPSTVVDMLNPANSGNPDTVQQRLANTMRGVMLKRQLKSNKSGSSPI